MGAGREADRQTDSNGSRGKKEELLNLNTGYFFRESTETHHSEFMVGEKFPKLDCVIISQFSKFNNLCTENV